MTDPTANEDLIEQDRQIRQAHDEAVRRGESTYVDPETGYLVLTTVTLFERGACCGSGCRHCPYGPEEQRRAGRPLS